MPMIGDIEVLTPECDRMLEIADTSHEIGYFLDWMEDQGWVIAEPTDRDYDDGRYEPVMKSFQQILAMYFEIDMAKVDNERKAILDALQAVRIE